MDNFDITKYLDMALRRKYWIIITFLLVILAGSYYILKAPKIYQAKTTILVQPQKVPQDFVRAIISSGTDDRLRTITQEVTSRTNLEKIIQEYNLYNSPSEKHIPIEAKVERLRKGIKIDVARHGGGENAFSISFQGKNPRKIMQVTNALASNFISENLKIRESQALGTANFLADELETITRRLVEKEERLKEYRLKHMGAMPEQLQANLNILGRLQLQMDQLRNNLSDVENRKLVIQKQKADLEILQKQAAEAGQSPLDVELPVIPTSEDTEPEELITLKKQLASLESRYTANHPDVKRMKQMIARLETEEDNKTGVRDVVPQPESTKTEQIKQDPVAILSSQLDQINGEIENLKNEIKKAKSQMDNYQKRVDETPKREQELLSLNRDYDNLRQLYNSMLSRRLEAEIAVSMEKKQKGEQFRVLDPAKTPTRPIKPDFRKLFLMTIAIGIGLGCGLAYLIEFMDTSYKLPDEMEKELGLPVLISIPILNTEKEVKRQKINNILTITSITIGFILSLTAVVITAKGLNNTLIFVKHIF